MFISAIAVASHFHSIICTALYVPHHHVYVWYIHKEEEHSRRSFAVWSSWKLRHRTASNNAIKLTNSKTHEKEHCNKKELWPCLDIWQEHICICEQWHRHAIRLSDGRWAAVLASYRCNTSLRIYVLPVQLRSNMWRLQRIYAPVTASHGVPQNRSEKRLRRLI